MNFYCSRSLWSIWQSLIPLSQEQRTPFGESKVTSDPAIALLKSMIIDIPASPVALLACESILRHRRGSSFRFHSIKLSESASSPIVLRVYQLTFCIRGSTELPR